MPDPDASFRERVYKLIAKVPYGRVTTYGDITALAGQPRAARIVGGIAHYGPLDLPWHRMVNRFGGLASGFVPGGREEQAAQLASEGISCENHIVVNFVELRWQK